jgi:predicted ATPase/DNA-binding SARP family transcriptional activator/DNA-binding CsgD family transcriptional regulator
MYFRGTDQVAQDPRGILPGVAKELLRVKLLGSFKVSVGARSIEESQWRLKKASGLVKVLALAPRHRLSREQAMDLFWPKLGPAAAANNLRYALHVARRILDPASPTAASRYLRFQGGVLELYPSGPIWVDAVAFEEAAVAAFHSRDPVAYEAAAELYTGDLLPQDRYEAWVEDLWVSLRRTYLALLVELAEMYEEHAEFELATETLEKVVKSEPTHEKAHVGLMRLYALSGQRLEALRQYERLRETLSRRLGKKPAAAGRHLYEEIMRGQSPLSHPPLVNHASKEHPRASQHNLPAARASFIGRERELGQLKHALATTRLLTLTGVCGSGKTRLALEVAKDVVGEFPDGVWLTELATLSERALVQQAVAAAVGVCEQPGRHVIATLASALREKNMLLVLDNCEHLIDAVAHLADILLSSCPHLQVLATSREALGLVGEVKWPVLPLSLPDPSRPLAPKNLAGCGSVRLFVERARRCHPAFALTVQNVGAVTDICRQLDGIPLAIELAAARVGTLSVKQVAERLTYSLALLTGGDRTVPPKQRTLHGALSWSYALLSKPERRLFERLSIFVGGWTLEAAEAVGTGDGIDRDNILDLLSRLVDKSLVMAEASVEGEPRYRMLNPIRRYGRERSEVSEQVEPTWRRYVAWFLELAEKAESELRGAQQELWLEMLEREHDNLRAVLSWVLEREKAELGLRLCGALGEFWHLRGHLSEGRRWLDAALAKGNAVTVPARAKALMWAGCIAWEQGDYERSIAFSEESLALSRKLEDTVGATAALSNLAWAALNQNELRRASKLAEELISLQRVSRDTAGVVDSLLILGMVAAVQRDYERASALHEESLAVAREVEDNFAIVLSLALGAFASLNQRYFERARNLCADGLELSQKLGMGQMIATHLHISAALAGSQGRLVNSATLWGAAEALREALGTVFSPVERYVYEPYIATAHAELEEAAWRAAWAEGRAMTLKEAIEYALSKEETALLSAPTPEKASIGEPLDELAPREWDVALLIVQGLTNRQIATELVISEHTVATYVGRILKKLGLHSRVQIAALVMEQQLLPLDQG